MSEGPIPFECSDVADALNAEFMPGVRLREAHVVGMSFIDVCEHELIINPDFVIHSTFARNRKESSLSKYSPNNDNLAQVTASVFTREGPLPHNHPDKNKPDLRDAPAEIIMASRPNNNAWPFDIGYLHYIFNSFQGVVIRREVTLLPVILDEDGNGNTFAIVINFEKDEVEGPVELYEDQESMIIGMNELNRLKEALGKMHCVDYTK